MKEQIRKFKEEKIAINVETEQEWIEFMELLEKYDEDLRWAQGERPSHFVEWEIEEEKATIACGLFNDSTIGFADSEFYEDEGYTVIKYKDFIKSEKDLSIPEDTLLDFIHNNIVIHLETKEEWDSFLEYLEKHTTLTWRDSSKPTKHSNNWNTYRENSVVASDGDSSATFGFADVDYFEANNRYIMKYKDIIEKEEKIVQEVEWNHLTTDEFIDAAKLLSYDVEVGLNGTIYVEKEDRTQVVVNKYRKNFVDVWAKEISDELFNLVIKYASTPVEARETEKKFKVRCLVTGEWLGGSRTWENGIHLASGFTNEELEQLGISKECYHIEEA